MIVQDKKLISYVRVKIISSYGITDEEFEQQINDFIKDKNIYDIQYKVDSDDKYDIRYDVVMVVYQVVKRV